MKRKRLQSGENVSERAERTARSAYGLDTTNSREYDARGGNSLYEIKSARMDMPSGERGRFQIFKEQHTRIRKLDNRKSAFYIFVVIDGSITRMKRKNPAHVGRVIAGRGGFRSMGHTSGPRHRLPISSLFDV